MGFWLEIGVSGFRIDAAPFLVEEITGDGETRKDFGFLDEMREFLSWRRGDVVMLAEANVEPQNVTEYVSNTRMHMTFAFYINQHLFLSLAKRDSGPLRDALDEVPDLPRLGQWAQFLRNHDELDLGWLSPEDRETVFRELAPEHGMELFHRGIRRRLAPMFEGDRRRIELANSLMFSLPGTPVIYYGDEIGMGEDLTLAERWPVRTCMQWSRANNAGFSTADKDQLAHPVIRSGPYGSNSVNVLGQQRDPNSLLNWFRRLCSIRQACPEIGAGKLVIAEADRPSVFSHRYYTDGCKLIVLHNLSEAPCTAKIDLPDAVEGDLVDLFGNEIYPSAGEGRRVDLDGFGYRWFRVEEAIP